MHTDLAYMLTCLHSSSYSLTPENPANNLGTLANKYCCATGSWQVGRAVRSVYSYIWKGTEGWTMEVHT